MIDMVACVTCQLEDMPLTFDDVLLALAFGVLLTALCWLIFGDES